MQDAKYKSKKSDTCMSPSTTFRLHYLQHYGSNLKIQQEWVGAEIDTRYLIKTGVQRMYSKNKTLQRLISKSAMYVILILIAFVVLFVPQ